MSQLIIIMYYGAGGIIFWAMIGYPLSLKILSKVYRNKKIIKDYTLLPTVTIMVVAHNEEAVIERKLENLCNLDYPKDKLEIIITSDNSTDKTNKIVQAFIEQHPEQKMFLYEVKERKGKTNAQNEAQKISSSEFLVMTDANAMLGKKAIRELMSVFVTEDISYVSGSLVYVNQASSATSNAEATYWNSELKLREIEARIQTITAGNGALYACRNAEYNDFEPIRSHDSAMPIHFALLGKRAIVNPDAIAYEKAGETVSDEFLRRKRMSRSIITAILPDIRILNFIKYKWFSYFYLGHKTCRYLLWLAHAIVWTSNLFLYKKKKIYKVTFIFQITFYILDLLKLVTKSKNKWLVIIHHYMVFIVAQWIGVYGIITGNAKPFWEKAETTR